MNDPQVVKNDEYVLPPQDRGDAPEMRPSKTENRNVEDVYHEDHYTLARNSGLARILAAKERKEMWNG